MTKPMIKEVNAKTGEELIRDMNDAEIAQLEADQEDFKAVIKSQEDKAIAKAALLERLGITDEEAKLLLG